MTYEQAIESLSRWVSKPHDEPGEPDGKAVKVLLDYARQMQRTHDDVCGDVDAYTAFKE